MTLHPRSSRGRGTRLLAVLAGLALLAAACGDDDDSPAPSGEATEDAADADGDVGGTDDDDVAADDEFVGPVNVTDSSGAEVIVESRPERIVSLSPTATEMLYAIGAGDQVVAVDEFSNHPAEAPTTDLSGFSPNVEAVIGYDPDLVVVQSDANDLVAGLTSAGVPVVQNASAADLDDAYAQIEQLGALTGHVGAAAEVVAEMRTDIDELLARVPPRDEPLTYYHELDDTYYTATSSTFIGQLYALAGFENIADAADPDGAAFGFPQLTAEYIVEANPDAIFLACTKFCDTNAETVGARDAWDEIRAVQDGLIFELDDDVVSRWGPRLVDFFAVVVEAAESVATVEA